LPFFNVYFVIVAILLLLISSVGAQIMRVNQVSPP